VDMNFLVRIDLDKKLIKWYDSNKYYQKWNKMMLKEFLKK
jgi:hypothetical protein